MTKMKPLSLFFLTIFAVSAALSEVVEDSKLTKPGSCPPLTKIKPDCIITCHNDTDCKNNLKCCKNGCSGRICVNPEIKRKKDNGYKHQFNYVSKLAFASYYGNHMVLQQSPKRSTIWGVGELKHSLTITLVGAGFKRMYHTSVELGYYPTFDNMTGVWRVMLDPTPAGGPYRIDVTDEISEDGIWLEDVKFGDVWVCSGQSNMQFIMQHLFNASEEIASANNYPDIRIMMVDLKADPKPRTDLINILEKWSISSNDSVGQANYFSAVCWMFGRYIYNHFKYPIGLIESNWGGTAVESWMSPDALRMCNVPPKGTGNIFKPNFEPRKYLEQTGQKVPHGVSLPWEDPVFGDQNAYSQLWNAMIHPLLNVTIKGALWYQGEANEGHPDNYNCTFPAMIDDWRSKFSTASGGQTDNMFPFGFVQLAANRPPPEGNAERGFPDIRWHQTADMGFVPNGRMKNVFFAVAMDLPDYKSPWSSIHPRDKQDVIARLGLSGLAVAYEQNIEYQGPYPNSFYIDIGFRNLSISFDKAIEVRSDTGFEVCCSSQNTTYCPDGDAHWVAAPVVASTNLSVTTLYKVGCENGWIVGLRYAWRESPCVFKKCPVYAEKTGLPLPPFVMNGIFGGGKRKEVRKILVEDLLKK